MTIRMDPQQIMDSLSDCHVEELHSENCESLIFEHCDPDIYEDFASGATKMVLLFRDGAQKQVVKIPFTHSEDVQYNPPKNSSEHPNYTYEYVPLRGAPLDNDWNYCAAEVDLYDLAEEVGVEKYFLKNELIGFLKGHHPVYVQPKASCFFDESRQMLTTIERKNLREECHSRNIDCFNAEWIRDFILCYGIDELVKLDEFLSEHDIYEDLHDGNLGYCEGKPVIIDYGGYYN